MWFYYESDNILPHPEGGIPILDQFMEFLSLNDDNFVVDEKLVDASISTDMTGTEMEITEANEEDEQLPTQHV